MITVESGKRKGTGQGPEPGGSGLVAAVVVITLLVLGLFAIYTGTRKHRRQTKQNRGVHLNRLKRCSANLNQLAVAMEMYSADNGGHYPKDFKALAPRYIKSIPTCPAAGSDTYSSSYRVDDKTGVYTFYCAGTYHGVSGIPYNFPQYRSAKGIVERP